jgi:hypothetical protein
MAHLDTVGVREKVVVDGVGLIARQLVDDLSTAFAILAQHLLVPLGLELLVRVGIAKVVHDKERARSQLCGRLGRM